MKYGRVMIFGASSGVGQAVAAHLQNACNDLITVSRRQSTVGRWMPADVTKPEDLERLANDLGDDTLDALLYLGGTWENNAFTEQYDFESCSDADLKNVLDVNLLAPIRVIQKLLPNLKKSVNAKIIVIGAAVGGLNLTAGREVSNTSSKFGLRGMVFSLRQTLSDYGIGITLINPGNIATPEVLRDLQGADKDDNHAIPLSDLFSTIEYVLQLSNRTNINEIDMPNM